MASSRPARFEVFDGFIAGLGTTSGVRLVIGIWPRSPLGSFADVMVETACGHRVLLAPRRDVADYVSSTYSFDEVRVEQVRITHTGATLGVTSESLDLWLRIDGRPLLGLLLWVVPAGLARARWWTSALDPIARRVLAGVRTRGSAGNGRSEWYSALDLHRLHSAGGSFQGRPLGDLAPVTPAVRFGFGSVPVRPSIVRVATTVGSA
jgi:hypothetical protein